MRTIYRLGIFRRSTAVTIAFGLLALHLFVLSGGIPAQAATTLFVNSTRDLGDEAPGDGQCDTDSDNSQGQTECTLRAAIEEANALAGVDSIHFTIPQSESGYAASPERFTITPTSLLPEISTPMIIDGSTQAEFAAHNRPVIEIIGTGVTAGEENGLWITGGGTTVRSLAINRFGDDGIDIEFSGGNTIVANYIGTNVTGTTARPNLYGINIKTAGNVVGGTDPADANVVSGNTLDGLYIYTSSATGNSVAGNNVGTDSTGTVGLGNGRNGIYLHSGANGNTIGGASASAGNVISGNGSGEAGILIEDPGTSGNTIRFNHIGTNAVGTLAIPNNLHGIWIDDAPNTNVWDNVISGNNVHGIYVVNGASTGTQVLRNTIGVNEAATASVANLYDGVRLESGASGTVIGSPGNGNVIAGNAQHGINLNSSSGNSIQANYIGTDSTGALDLGNTWSGIFSDVFGSSNNLVGGDAAGGNTIRFNDYGITFESGLANAVIGNSIYTNDNFGIDLNGDGVTPNDVGDGDIGPNNVLNFPVFTSATASGGIVTLTGTFDVPAGNYRFEFFSNPSGADPLGFGEGESFVATSVLSHTGSGDQAWGAAFPGSIGDVITATLTEDLGGGSFGSTSEFSAATTVTNDAHLVNTVGDLPDATPGDGKCDTGGPLIAGNPECTLRAAIQESNAPGGTDQVHFDIPGAGPHTIQPLNVLPTIAREVNIDATTEPDFAGSPVVVIEGSLLSGSDDGLRVNGPNTTIRGFVIGDFPGDGIEVGPSATGTTIAGNYIGTNVAGTAENGNFRGIDLGAGSTTTTVGGTSLADRNVISGNKDDGIVVWISNNNTIIGNYIGTDSTGLLPVANSADGIAFGGGSSNNIIGQAGSGNVLSGNVRDGLEIDNLSGSNVVQGNLIGLGRDGSTTLSNGRHGLVLYDGANSTQVGGPTAAQRNVISSNVVSGVVVDGNGGATTTANVFHNNYIGTDITGNLNRGNGSHGIHLFSGATTNDIGGVGLNEGNVISGNGLNGVYIEGNGTDGNDVLGNLLGTNATGSAPLGNGRAGVYIENSAESTTVGGSVAGARNIISGNAEDGLYITSPGTSLTVVAGNYIGTDVMGSSAIPNGDRGVQIESGATDTTIGGSALGAGNVISGNTGDGIIVADWQSLGTTRATIQGNYVGVQADGVSPLGNGAQGVHIDPVSDSLIGGTGPNDGNVIAYNARDGVILEPASGTGNSILGNSIYSNGDHGIDLGNDGTTTNDFGDGDSGPNDYLNHPIITSATESAGTITVDFQLDVAPGNYRIELFANPSGADPSGYGEGESFAGSYDVVLHPGGLAAYTTTLPGATGDVLTATTTEEIGAPFGSTSEFSPAFTATGAGDTTPPVITLIGANPQTIEVGSSYVELGATASDNVDGDISGSIVIDASAVDTAVLGSYVVTYDVTDSSGNPAIQQTRTVDVVDTTAPEITLTGANPQTVEVGSPYTELGATATDDYDGDITGSIAIDATAVNTAVTGSYVVTYDVTDASGNAATQRTRTVDVVDTTAPVITLVGANPQTVEVGSPYTEIGATANDDYDGDITGSIVIDASSVDTAVVGTYPVTYNVTDSSGNNATQVTRTVDVVDTTVPVITLVGANPQTIEVGSPYVELGASASDNYDGDISGSIVIDASSVNTAATGSYVVTYDVMDSSGNAATQRTRTVDIVDTTAPVITLSGANPQTIEVGSPYVELGASASDNYDGDITGSIVIDASSVNTAATGSYVVTYDVMDSSGNAATQRTRTVDIVDTTAPVITLSGANPQTIEVGSPYVELGASASDNYDGDITGSIVIDATAVDTAVVGTYPVTYNVTDSSGNNATQVTRTVDVVDTGAPVITLLGSDPITLEVGSAYVDSGATAWDAVDGDITGSIVTVNPVDTGVTGSYVVTYDVTDSSGNAATQVTRTVDVVDTTAPVITLLGSNPQAIEVGSPYVELGATASDNYDGDITGSIVIDATAVDTAVLGSYAVTYNVTDSSGNNATQRTRTVDVVDTTSPVIALIGANPQTIEVGSPYIELGATANDNYDGDITGGILIDATAVDTAVLGSYAVTYNVTDSSGNNATQRTRTVDVVDTTSPVIALIGANPQTIEVGLPYIELGATANDNYDGDISGSIVIDASSVNTAATGSYVVTYDVMDSSGNAATQRTRTVDIVDTTAPVITLSGANPQTIEVGSPYVELGATASDSYDGDLTGGILLDASAVNTAIVGGYPVTYNVTDSSGNSATQRTRTVNVVDTTAPAITLVGANPQTIEAGTPYVELGATANDNYDGDITGSIVVDATAVNTAVVGSYVVTYNVTDTSGNPATTVSRTVNVADTTAPVITVLGANPQNFEVGSPYVELGATAFDPFYGDLTSAIVIDTSGVDTATPGLYAAFYNVQDATGNAAIQQSRVVIVTDTNDAPIVTPIPDWAVAEGSPMSFVISATDPEGDTLIFGLTGPPTGADIDPLSGVFTWTPSENHGPGTYVINVTVTDNGAPPITTSTDFTVTVTEVNSAPVISPVSDQSNSEGESIVLLIQGTDADLPENTVFYSASGLPPGLSIDSGTGHLSGTISAGAAAGSPYSVTLRLRDGGTPSLSDETTFTWTVAETPNLAPIAVDDVYRASGTMMLSVEAPGVLENDSDPNGDDLAVTLIASPQGGALVFGADGGFTFTPDGTEAEAYFTYEVTDAAGEVATAQVTIVIQENRPPVAVNDTIVLETLHTVELDVLSNDHDPERDTLTLASINAGSLAGTIEINENTTIIYNPRPDFSGFDRFSYLVVDGGGNSATATVTVEIPDHVVDDAEEESERFGSASLAFANPEPVVQGIPIDLGFQMTLMTEAFFQSLGALTMPLAFLLIAVTIILAWARLGQVPLWLGGTRKRFWSVVMLPREALLEVRSEPSADSEVLYHYSPTAAGVTSTGRAENGFLPVDAPRGSGWIDQRFTTPTIDLDYFMADPKPVQIVRQLAVALDGGDELAELISPRGLLLSIGDRPLHVDPERVLQRHQPIHTAHRIGRGRSAVASLQRDVFEALRQALLDLATIGQDMAHSENALIPSELWNFPYLAIHAPGHEPWLIHFEYVGRRPYIIGISLDR